MTFTRGAGRASVCEELAVLATSNRELVAVEKLSSGVDRLLAAGGFGCLEVTIAM